jgi:hypothetical protein
VLALVTACKPESARRADRAAKDVVEQREELAEAARKLPDKGIEGTREVIEEAGELAKAVRELERQKSRRLVALHAAYDICATRAGVVAVLARDLPITDAARGEINEKLTRLDARLLEAADMIDGLGRVQIDEWEEQDDAVTGAMDRLEDAAADAWEALEDAPRIDPAAS